MARRAPAIATALVLLVLASGCASLVDREADTDGTDTVAPPGEEPVEECTRQAFHTNDSASAPRSAWLECRANLPGTDEQALECGGVDEAEAQVKTNLTAGQVRLTVEDASGTQLARETIGDTGGEIRPIPLDTRGSQPGTWTLTAERLEGFDGVYEAELWCPHGP